MEPATGASTWALGSHKWKIYKGIFTIKAVIVIIHHIFIKKDEDKMDEFIEENIKRCELCLYRKRILTNKGKLAAIV